MASLTTLRPNASVAKHSAHHGGYLVPASSVLRSRRAHSLPHTGCEKSFRSTSARSSKGGEQATLVSSQPCREETKSAPSPWSLKGLLSGLSHAAAVLGVAAVLVLGNPPDALAARSGGRVGGTAGFSRSAGSYGGGGGSRGYSSSGSSSRYSASQSAGYGSRSYTAPPLTSHTTVITPGFSPGYGMPMVGGYGYGGYSGYASGPVVVHGGGYGSGLSLALPVFLGTALLLMWASSAVGTRRSTGSAQGTHWQHHTADADVTVSKVQVCLLSVARELKEELDGIGATANTSNVQGLHLLLQETILALLRNPQYWVSASSTAETLPSAKAAERAFGSLALGERSHFQEETLVNAEGRGVKKSKLRQGDDNVSEYMVVTLLVASQGRWGLPPIRSQADLRTALKRLGGVTTNNIMAVDLMWTPQAENDSLTQQDVITNYPDLRPL